MNTPPLFTYPSTPGTAIIPVFADNDYGYSVTVQPDGKIVVAGTSDNGETTDFSVIRLNTDGSLDTSFSGNGKSVIQGNYVRGDGNSIILQSDGKIVLAGSSYNGNTDFSLIRLNSDGSLDTSFSGDGKAIIPVGTGSDYGEAITLQSDGKILVAGTSVNGNRTDFSLIRLNADGSLDTSFNGSGKAIIAVGARSDYAYSVTVQPDGKILVAGTSVNANRADFSLIRLNADGSLDTSFNGTGKAIIPVGVVWDIAYGVNLQSDGKIVVAGISFNSGSFEFSVLRLNADGSLDTSFNGSGKALIPVPVDAALRFGRDCSVTVQPDDKIVIAGGTTYPYDLSVIRLNADGTLDPSFSGDGKATFDITFDIGGYSEHGKSLSVQADGKIVVAGTSSNGNDLDFSVIRLNADGSLDSSFNPNPTAINTLGGTVAYTENAGHIALDESVAIFDAELAAMSGGRGNYAGASVTLARHGGASAEDVFSAVGFVYFYMGNVMASDITVGTLTNSAGTLTITFNGGAVTQSLVNDVLSSIYYTNTSDAPPASVQIDWTFSDGNTGNAQGTGGALTASGSTTVNITAVNDAPTGGISIEGIAAVGETLFVIDTLSDADGLDYVEYQWRANGVDIEDAFYSSYTLTEAEAGKTITVQAFYTDKGFTNESVLSAGVVAIGNSQPVFRFPATPGTAIISLGDDDYPYDQARNVTIQPDGKLVVAGTSFNGVGLVRLNTDGSLDTSFDGDGKAIMWTSSFSGRAMTPQADSKILMAGYSYNGSNYDFSLVRLNADGSLDTSFDGDGEAIIPVGTSNDEGYAITLQADGKILVAGTSYNGSNDDFSLIRLNADGSLDTSFSGDGKAIIPVGTRDDYGQAITLQADGKILVAGYSSNGGSNNDFSLIRLHADGSLDTSFDGDGMAIIPVGAWGDEGYAITLQADGKIIVAGTSDDEFGLVRLNANGSLDTSFDWDGKAIIPVGVSGDVARTITLQADGKIVVAGESYDDNGKADFSLIRLNFNGSLDNSFGTGGKAIIPMSATDDYGYSVTLQPDGKIVLVGTSYIDDAVNHRSYLAVIRLNANGTLDASFNAAGTQPFSAASYTENASAVALASAATVFDADMAALNGGVGNYNGASLRLARSEGPDAQDVFSALGSLSFVGASVLLAGTPVGTLSNDAGTLEIVFNSNASQAVVNQVLSSIAYANTSDAPPASVQIDWTFSEGNTGNAQGPDGALTATVNITAVNDAPTGGISIEGIAAVGETLFVIDTLSDVDGLDYVEYQWRANGVDIEDAYESSYTLTEADARKIITVQAVYTDGGNTDESVGSAGVRVANYIDDSDPSIVILLENTKTATTVVPSDPLIGAKPKYTLSGEDADLFKISGKGVLTLRAALDHEVPTDADQDGTYYVSVTMTHAKTGDEETQDLAFKVAFAAIEGTSSADNLKGTKGRDTLDGLAGNDKLTGGDGLDTFLISAGNDTVMDFNALGKAWTGPGQEVLQIEAGASATATVKSAWTATAESFNLGDGLLFTAALEVNLSAINYGQGWDVVNKGKTTTLTGSMFDDTLTGGSGSDTLVGGAGDDKLIGSKLAGILTGGLGADTFQIGGTKGTTTAHRITDFASGEDRIALDNAVFKALRVEGGVLTEGQLAANQFVQGTAATTADQRLIYNSANGQLLYDVDGSGKKAAVLVGMLDNLVPLVSTDLWVV